MTDDEIAAIVERFPLPEGVPDVVLNKRDLAEFLAVSLPTLDAWISSGMPALSKGTNGREWEFQASAAWAWKSARDESERAKSTEAQLAIQKMRLALVGGKAGNSMQALPPKERQQLYDVEAAWEKLCRERNQTLDRDEVNAVMNDLLRIVRDSLSMLPDTLERKVGLSGKGVDAAVEHCDDILGELDQAVEKFFSDRPVIKRDNRDTRKDLFN